jgi:hypothetical protein
MAFQCRPASLLKNSALAVSSASTREPLEARESIGFPLGSGAFSDTLNASVVVGSAWIGVNDELFTATVELAASAAGGFGESWGTAWSGTGGGSVFRSVEPPTLPSD